MKRIILILTLAFTAMTVSAQTNADTILQGAPEEYFLFHLRPLDSTSDTMYTGGVRVAFFPLTDQMQFEFETFRIRTKGNGKILEIYDGSLIVSNSDKAEEIEKKIEERLELE